MLRLSPDTWLQAPGLLVRAARQKGLFAHLISLGRTFLTREQGKKAARHCRTAWTRPQPCPALSATGLLQWGAGRRPQTRGSSDRGESRCLLESQRHAAPTTHRTGWLLCKMKSIWLEVVNKKRRVSRLSGATYGRARDGYRSRCTSQEMSIRGKKGTNYPLQSQTFFFFFSSQAWTISSPCFGLAHVGNHCGSATVTWGRATPDTLSAATHVVPCHLFSSRRKFPGVKTLTDANSTDLPFRACAAPPPNFGRKGGDFVSLSSHAAKA